MKIFIKILNVIGALFASVFMPILLALCIATPVVSAVCSFTHPEDITAMIKSIDMEEIVLASPDIEKALADAGVSAEAIDKILYMKIISEFTEMYIDDVTSILTGEISESAITPERILALYDKHSGEVVELIKNFNVDQSVDMMKALKRTLDSDKASALVLFVGCICSIDDTISSDEINLLEDLLNA